MTNLSVAKMSAYEQTFQEQRKKCFERSREKLRQEVAERFKEFESFINTEFDQLMARYDQQMARAAQIGAWQRASIENHERGVFMRGIRVLQQVLEAESKEYGIVL